MKIDLSGKKALITGAGSGIGRAIALRLCEEGMQLALCGRSMEKLQAVQALCPGSVILPGDLMDDEYLSGLPQAAEEALGGLDVLVNNAGLAQRGPLEDVTPEEFDQIWKTDVRAPYFLCQKSLPILRRSQTPAIINIASALAHSGYPMQSAYAAAKHALLGFSKSLANEVYQEGIRVHVVSPGGVATGMVALTRPDLAGSDMIMPEDVADAVAYLLSRRSGAVIDEIRMHRSGKEPFA